MESWFLRGAWGINWSRPLRTSPEPKIWKCARQLLWQNPFLENLIVAVIGAKSSKFWLLAVIVANPKFQKISACGGHFPLSRSFLPQKTPKKGRLRRKMVNFQPAAGLSPLAEAFYLKKTPKKRRLRRKMGVDFTKFGFGSYCGISLFRNFCLAVIREFCPSQNLPLGSYWGGRGSY